MAPSARGLRSGTRRAQTAGDGESDSGAGSGPVADMTLLDQDSSGALDASSAAGGAYVDDDGVAHVSVDDGEDWTSYYPNGSTVRVVYEGSGSTEEILLVPVGDDSSDTSAASTSLDDSAVTTSPVYTLPTGSSDGSSGSESTSSGTTTSSAIVASQSMAYLAVAVGVVAVVVVALIVVYFRKAWRHRTVEIPGADGEFDRPFVEGQLRRRLDPSENNTETRVPSAQWREGQQSGGNQSSSFHGTEILSDNNTVPAHRRGTVDVASSYNAQRRVLAGDASLRDIMAQLRYRSGTAPVVLYEQRS